MRSHLAAISLPQSSIRYPLAITRKALGTHTRFHRREEVLRSFLGFFSARRGKVAKAVKENFQLILFFHSEIYSFIFILREREALAVLVVVQQEPFKRN